MAKVSIGLRGWRFEESEVFTDEGDLRPMDEIPEDARHRLLRLSAIVGEPCDACWLADGGDNAHAWNQADVVYGEPVAEVLLCADHETDFLYWFRECGGDEYAGTADLPDRFHEWFDDGGRAPQDYAGLEHVDRDPDSLPDPDRPAELDEVEEQVEGMDEAEREALDMDLGDLDL
ncbi:MAG: hypothetical protein ABEH64_05630 [Salinirussus sp.]